MGLFYKTGCVQKWQSRDRAWIVVQSSRENHTVYKVVPTDVSQEPIEVLECYREGILLIGAFEWQVWKEPH